MRSSFPSNGIRARAVSSCRVYVAYVRACIMQEDGPRSRNISPPPAHRRPKCIHPIIFASPCPTFQPPRVPRCAATFSPLTLYLRRRICMECIHMKSTILPLASPPVAFSLSPSLFHSLARTHSRHDRLRGTSLGSLCSTVNPTEDTRDVTCVAENWFVSNNDVLSFSPSPATHLPGCYNSDLSKLPMAFFYEAIKSTAPY